MIRRRSQPMVCLDFGRDQLTAVEVLDGTVTRWASRPLDEAGFRNGDPIAPDAIAGAVRHALVGGGFTARHARFALPDQAAVTRLITLPHMPRRDLARAMHYAAEKHVPFPIARARWAWDVVGRDREGVTVYLVATWRDVVERFAEVARLCGLVAETLEPRSLAVARALAQDSALVVDAGERRLHATLVVRGQPVYVDEMAVAGRADRMDAVDRLVQRAYRHQSVAAGAGGRLAPVLFAGDLELADVDLPVGGRPVAEVLNGQLPAAPRGFRPGAYLANLGLAMGGRG